MRLLVNELEASGPRPRSPHMNNEEPINLSHYPDGKKPDDESAPRPIERDDFPGKIPEPKLHNLIIAEGSTSKNHITGGSHCTEIALALHTQRPWAQLPVFL